MTLSAPSFLAAATSASIPPMASAEVASLADAPALPDPLLVVVVPELLGGAHAATARAAPTAIADSSARRLVTGSCLRFRAAAVRRTDEVSGRYDPCGKQPDATVRLQIGEESMAGRC